MTGSWVSRCAGIGRVLAAAVVFAGAVLIASPGSAAAYPYWNTYTKTSKWHCTQSFPQPEVMTESCVVINGNYTQAVAIIGNSTGEPITIAAPHQYLWVQGAFAYDHGCLSSTLNTGYSRACFGPTRNVSCTNWVQASAALTVNGTTETVYSPVEFMCL